MNNEIYEMYKRNFPYINREEKTVRTIIDNDKNIVFEKRNSNNELIGCAIVNDNAILLLVVDEKYRNIGIGTELLNKCERAIIENGYDKVVLGVGFDYLMPGVPTSKKYTESVHENLKPEVNDNASTFFEKRGYNHSWEKCNCFDMQMSLDNIKESNNTLGDTINGITFRWATKEDIDSIVECADDACQYQDEKFSKYYTNPNLYEENNNQKVLVAVKDNKQKLYEDWKFGKIDKEEYLKETDSIKKEIDNLNNQYKINEENYTEILKNKSKDDSWIEHYKRNRKIKKVSKKVLKELVDSILVNEDKSIKVIFKYRDSYNECLNLLKGEVLNNE